MTKEQAIEALIAELSSILAEANDTDGVHPFSRYRAQQTIKAAWDVLGKDHA